MTKQQLKALLVPLILFTVLLGGVLLYNGLSKRFRPAQPELSAEGKADASAQSVPFDPKVPSAADAAGLSGEEKKAADAPDFTMLDMNGETVSLSSFFGEPIVVNFWATWCPPCASELPHFDKAAAEYEGKVRFLMVDLTDGRRDTVESAKAYVEERGYTFPLYFDTESSGAIAYAVYSIPLTVFINADGNIQASRVGAMNEEMLYDYLEELTAGTQTP
jgi:thiol-disulfide isomerase/thioredoxin